MDVVVEIDAAAVTEALRRLTGAVEDMTPLFMEIGEGIRQGVVAGFEQGADPEGKRWEPLKYRKGRPLMDTGALRGSIIARAMASEAEIGTNLNYAVIHQFGGAAGRNLAATIPARPFFPTDVLPAAWQIGVESAVARYFERVIS